MRSKIMVSTRLVFIDIVSWGQAGKKFGRCQGACMRWRTPMARHYAQATLFLPLTVLCKL